MLSVLIAVGTGNDWARHHGHVLETTERLSILIALGNIKSQDLGADGRCSVKENETVYFMNYAGLGFDGYVISKIEKYKFLGPLSYLGCGHSNFISFKR